MRMIFSSAALALLGALALAPSHAQAQVVRVYYGQSYYAPAYEVAPVPVVTNSYYVAPSYYTPSVSYYVAPAYVPTYTTSYYVAPVVYPVYRTYYAAPVYRVRRGYYYYR